MNDNERLTVVAPPAKTVAANAGRCSASAPIAVSPASLNNGKMYLLYLGYGLPMTTLTTSGGTSYT